ncbi:MAG: hypothetical protein U9R75_10320 [Candidatus Thermoplasmatota archaeon]|nr:hypothetical protein [Candidatus Thermoplasmatota archaeon]
MGFRIFDRLFRRGREEGRLRHDREEYYDYDEPPASEDLGLLVDHHFIYPSEDDYEKHVGGMEFVIDIENNTDFPMGNLKVTMGKRFKLGKFGQPRIPDRLIDPGQKTRVSVPFTPIYQGGKEQYEFEISFFDFKYKEEERITLTSEPLKVVVPKFKELKKDEDGYRMLTGDLYRWVLETGVMKIPPREMYVILIGRLEKMGFKTSDEMINESLFRGINKLTATDSKARKWAVQVQVIGKDKECKFLLYTYGERPLQAYNLSVKTLLKIDRKEMIMGSLDK